MLPHELTATVICTNFTKFNLVKFSGFSPHIRSAHDTTTHLRTMSRLHQQAKQQQEKLERKRREAEEAKKKVRAPLPLCGATHGAVCVLYAKIHP